MLFFFTRGGISTTARARNFTWVAKRWSRDREASLFIFYMQNKVRYVSTKSLLLEGQLLGVVCRLQVRVHVPFAAWAVADITPNRPPAPKPARSAPPWISCDESSRFTLCSPTRSHYLR